MKEPMDVLREFPVRKSRKQKRQFRDAVTAYLESLGYLVHVEKGSFGSRNIVAGDPENARYVITAHYDTCAELPFPNFVTPCSFLGFLGCQIFLVFLIVFLAAVPVFLAELLFPGNSAGVILFDLILLTFCLLTVFGPANPHCTNDNTSGVITLLHLAADLPENRRNQVCFVLFDLEEAGLLGSASYVKTHKQAVKRQMNLNLDCVGDGDELLFFPTKRLKKNSEMVERLNYCLGTYGNKQISIRRKGFAFYPSDQANFPYGVGICALRKKFRILYLGRIHTRRDTVLDETNVNLLRAAIISMICCGAVK